MKKNFNYQLLAGYLFISLVNISYSQNILDENRIRDIGSLIVRIKTYDEKGNEQKSGNGSGLIVGTTGGNYYVITAKHVIDSAGEIKINVNNIYWSRLTEVIEDHPFWDFAVLKFEPDSAMPVLNIKLPVGEVPGVGSPLRFLGYPGGDFSHISAGIKVKDENYPPGAPSETFLAEGNIRDINGASGGVVLDNHGNLVGMMLEQGTDQNQGYDGILCLKLPEYIYAHLKWLNIPVNFLQGADDEKVFLIKSMETNQYLTLFPEDVDKPDIRQFAFGNCSDIAKQQFVFIPAKWTGIEQVYMIKSRSNGRFLSISRPPGMLCTDPKIAFDVITAMEYGDNARKPEQYWRIEKQADESYKIENLVCGKYLTVSHAGHWGPSPVHAEEGRTMQVWVDFSRSDGEIRGAKLSQFWYLIPIVE